MLKFKMFVPALERFGQIFRNHPFRMFASRCYRVTRPYFAQQIPKAIRYSDDQSLVVTWNNGNTDKYPYLYLRENCRCSQCYKDVHNARIVYVPKCIDLKVTPMSAFLNASDELNVKWKDGHCSIYSSEYLKSISYKKPGERHGVLKKEVELWGGNVVEEKLPLFDFEQVLKDEDELYKWLTAVMVTTGIAKFVNVPTKPRQLERLGTAVGYLAGTFYGATEFAIKAYGGEKAKEIGYTNAELPAHTDYAFCVTSPAIAMLHCLQQSAGKGGGNNFVDAFHAAKILYEEDPEGFRFLTSAPVQFNNKTLTKLGNYHNIVHRNIISTNRDGLVTQIAYSDEFRDAYMPHPPEQMPTFYRGYFRFSELLHDQRTVFNHKMKAGEMVTLNNHRVLHGRSAYEDTEDNVRHLQLGYFDLDCVHAKMRVMAKERGVECPVD